MWSILGYYIYVKNYDGVIQEMFSVINNKNFLDFINMNKLEMFQHCNYNDIDFKEIVFNQNRSFL
jgi:hypothetical protein